MSQSRLSIIPSRAVSDESLTATQLRVLCAIGSFTGKDQSAYPKQATIAEVVGVARETVNRAVKSLEKAGYIEVHKQCRDDGGQRANLYVVKLDPCDATITPPVTVGITPPVTPAVTPNRTIHKNDTNSDELVGAQSADTQPEQPKPKTRKKRRTRIKEGWSPTPVDYAYASKKGLSPQEINHEADQFCNHHTSKGTLSACWSASWRTWVGNRVKWNAERESKRQGRRYGQPVENKLSTIDEVFGTMEGDAARNPDRRDYSEGASGGDIIDAQPLFASRVA